MILIQQYDAYPLAIVIRVFQLGTYIASDISIFAQQAGKRSTVQHSSPVLQVKTLLGSSVSDPFTGQSIKSAELKSDGTLGSVTAAIVRYIFIFQYASVRLVKYNVFSDCEIAIVSSIFPKELMRALMFVYCVKFP